MRRFAGIVAVLLLLTTAAPVLACVSGAAMSREENACCRNMHGQCGSQMANMKDMGCCRTESRTDKTPQAAATVPSSADTVALHSQLVAMSTPLAASALLKAVAYSHVPIEQAPPNLRSTRTTVLRI